ncbi:MULTISPECIES: helicase HerA-like domain-containing protein [unclassified Streptomyces]|uniref:helicase HerA-like domain-containing protein n=1 Tax=unclassified Streptomyces TaxID=2593676 RepID=UPI000DC785FB|nr:MULTISPECIES: helicase HerA-like domain-containing protein [unclassified Streptomyces]AWZ05175.1 ATP-binding protein [Streptomyces sp. ICC4]AWZ11545.1 ATP-binding protein [Streptomyces sp. ICC1]
MSQSTAPASPAGQIAAGYAFTGPALDLGALLWDGACLPELQIRIPLSMLNRHGLVAGATGTGKTKTLQLIAEQLSANGVPVFLADIKGDVSGISAPGAENEKVAQRAADVAQEWRGTGFPSEFYSLGGIGPGIPLRSTVTSFGPVLMSKVLQLNQTQEQSLGLIFHYADAKGLELIDLKDLRAVVAFLVSDKGKAELKGIGGLSTVTAGVILRALTAFEQQGAAEFFGEPEFDTSEFLRTAADGRGLVSVLELPAVQDKPQLFSTFLMWLLADLYTDLPEVGDLEKPKLVFFFDEAHLLFNGASKAFLEAITQTVRLIRSKGIGVFFVTQTPKDVPADVLAQLGNRVQHALRAFTPDDAKALKATVKTFPNSAYDLEELLTQLGTGEAVITVLSENGAPTPVAATRLRAPQSLMGPIDAAALDQAVKSSLLYSRYAEPVDRESAYEKISAEQAAAEAEAEAAAAAAEAEKQAKEAEKAARNAPKPDPSLAEQVVGSGLFRSLARSIGTQLGREISRSIFGTARRRR